MSKYPWDQAPAWAQYAATDGDGSQWWFEKEPFYDADDKEWSPGSGMFDVFQTADPASSMEARP